jgi:hypothetical protein
VTVIVFKRVSKFGLNFHQGVSFMVNESVSVVRVTVKYLVLVSVISLLVHEGVAVIL